MTVAWDIPSNGHPTSKLCSPLRRRLRRGRAHHADSSQPGQGQFHNNPLSMCKYRDYPSERRRENAARVGGGGGITSSFIDQYRREGDRWMMDGSVETKTVHVSIPYCCCPASTDLVCIRGIDFVTSTTGHPRCHILHLLVRPSWSLPSHKHLYSSSTSEPSPAKSYHNLMQFLSPIVPRMWSSPPPNLITRRRAHTKPMLPPTRWIHHGCRRRAI
ncbi:hypothetical protein CGRA01v4_11777 [Colletotrichum graminicola]|nr:hypothetical protein CGRA01v4_11777 [Colletotrichum graminicola]